MALKDQKGIASAYMAWASIQNAIEDVRSKAELIQKSIASLKAHPAFVANAHADAVASVDSMAASLSQLNLNLPSNSIAK